MMFNEKTFSLTPWVLSLFAFLCHQSALGQSADELTKLRQEMSAMQQEIRAIQDDVEEIKNLLRSGAAPQEKPFLSAEVSVEGSHFLGEKNAKVTIIEFTDYECGFCARHVSQVFPRIVEDYVETGKVKYVVRQFPLVTIHKAASKASEVSLCAADEGKFWEMHDAMFENQKALASKELEALVESVGVDSKKVQDCLDTGKYTAQVRADIAEGTKAGVRGTPTFLFGLTDPGSSKIKITKRMKGYVPYAQMAAVIDVLLSRSE